MREGQPRVVEAAGPEGGHAFEAVAPLFLQVQDQTVEEMGFAGFRGCLWHRVVGAWESRALGRLYE
jgi:hypothetical protein